MPTAHHGVAPCTSAMCRPSASAPEGSAAAIVDSGPGKAWTDSAMPPATTSSSQTMFATASTSPAVDAMASTTTIMLINDTDRRVGVRADGHDVTLDAWQVATVARN